MADKTFKRKYAPLLFVAGGVELMAGLSIVWDHFYQVPPPSLFRAVFNLAMAAMFISFGLQARKDVQGDEGK